MAQCPGACTTEEPFPFSFAFQPIIDTATNTIFSYEALVRGPGNEPASWVLDHVRPENQYSFDQACRVKALSLASALGGEARLNINFLPNAIYEPSQCIRSTLAAASRLSFPVDRIVFEVTEGESIADQAKLVDIFAEYSRLGFKTAIDDFGAGYAGLGLLADFQPDYVKIDMKLVRDIAAHGPKQAIVRAIVAMCRELGVTVIAEGIETLDEYAWLRNAGIELFQGYLFARPSFESFPHVTYYEGLATASGEAIRVFGSSP